MANIPARQGGESLEVAAAAWRLPVRGLLFGGGVLVVLVLVAFFGASCYVAGEMRNEAFDVDHGPPDLPLLVASVAGDTIVLDGQGRDQTKDWNRDGTFGLEGEHGFGQVGQVLARGDGTVTREFHLQQGTIGAGDRARIEGFAWRGSPSESLGIQSQDVTFAAPSGPLAAWFVPGERDTWVIFIHGKGASRDEALRILPTVHAAGYPALGITYRNDPGAPADPSGDYGYGTTEWPDAEAAIDYATAHGARSVILYGYSMGGAISLATLRNSDRAGMVSALVLDAPMLRLKSVIRHQANGRGVPGIITPVAQWIMSWRYDTGWGSFDYMDDAAKLAIPVLILHGDADDDVPVADSRELAGRNPGHVTLVEFADAGHVRSWNLHSEEYESVVAQFLDRPGDGEATATR